LICGFLFVGTKEGEGSSSVFKASKIRGWQAEEEGTTNHRLLFFLLFSVLSLEWFSFVGVIAYEKKREDFVREFWYWWFGVNDIAGVVFFLVLICWGFMCRNGARESKRRRWTTWFCLIKLHTISYFLKLQSISLSLLLSCLTDWGYVPFALHYFSHMLLVLIVHISLYALCF